MRNKFEMMPESVKNKEVLEDSKDAAIEKIVEEGQGSKPEDGVVSNHEKHTAEMREEEAKVAPEIEAKFRDALTLLYVRIQLRKGPEKEFPDKKELAELLEEIPLFSQMHLGAKKLFLTAFNKAEEFKSNDEEVFIKKGLEVLDLVIHSAILKQGGDAWHERKARERGQTEQVPPTSTGQVEN